MAQFSGFSELLLPEMGIEDPGLIQQYQMDSFGKNNRKTCSSGGLFPYPALNLSPLDITETQQHFFKMDREQVKGTGSWNSCTTEQASSPEDSSPTILSFGNSNSPTSHTWCYRTSEDVKPKVEPANNNFVSDSYQSACMNQNYEPKATQGNKRVVVPRTKPAPYSQDHVVAERKRREKLSQRFIALSAIVPGLKKIDKASVLENTIRYVKELQVRVKELERKTAEKPMESIVFVKKIQISSDDDSSSTEVTSKVASIERLPEIVTRVSDRSVLMRIHCRKQNAVLDKTMAEIKKLKLSVISSSMIPFGAATVDITVVAEMGEDLDMAVKDLVKNLDSSLRQFM